MSSTYQAHTQEKEFSFWGSPNAANTIISSETQYKRNDFKFEHHCSTVSDPSRSKAIAEGRKELMEMMQHMPESSYELSFQDMVVEQHEVSSQPQPDQNEAQQPQQKKLEKEKKKKKMKNIKSNRPGQILRVESMDSETFLLKMFFPSSLDWTKKSKVQNGSKVSPKPSLLESTKEKDKEWRIKRFFTEDIVGQNTGCSNDKSRHVDRSFSLSRGCWPFFQYMKSKTKRLGG